jgi:hypothetical protein
MKENIYLQEIQKNIAVEFIQKYHYSKILPRLTKFYIGVFFPNSELCGVITLGWGTQPLGTIRKIFYRHDLKTTDYFEIGKMCFIPSLNNSNSGSYILKLLMVWLKENTEIKFIYTLADGIMGKCGYVYQASNFYYIGNFKTSVYYDTQTGEKIHPRSAKKLCEENARLLGKKKVFWLTSDFCSLKKIDKINGLMFRYILPIDKKSKRILSNYPEYINNKNPKDKDLVFERRIGNGKFEKINKPNFNMGVFNHNYQKY